MTAPLYERDPDAWYAQLAEGNAKQARKRVAADALIRDEESRFLIVNPTYKPGWDLPGGMVEANEPPLDALRRELAEELGLDLPAYRLLCVDWVAPHGPWDDLLAFVFDGGVLSAADRERLAVRDPEISAFRFVTHPELLELLGPRLRRRVGQALEALRAGTTRYLQDGSVIDL
jgi:8-oxo-dGTP diphosphatase